MPHSDETFYKMKCGWADDRKVASLARFGAVDACLGRDLFAQAIDYARRELTDGEVPRDQIPKLVYPLPPADAMRIADQLADPGPYGPLCQWHTASNALCILGYAHWNDTRAEVEARRQQGVKAARVRWDSDQGRDAGRNAAGNAGRSAPAIDRAPARVHTEQEQERETPPTPPAAGTAEGTRGAGPSEEEGELDNRIVAVMVGLGRTVTRAGAAAIRAGILGDRTVEAPGPYVLAAIRRDPGAAVRLAEGAAPVRARPEPPPAAVTLAQTPRNPHAAEHARTGAALARDGLEEVGRRAEARQAEARRLVEERRAAALVPAAAEPAAELPLEPPDTDEYPF